MSNPRTVFHAVSYLQYLFIGFGVIYLVLPLLGVSGTADVATVDLTSAAFTGFIVERGNVALLMIGIGVSLSTVQDTRTTQNTLSERIWRDPIKGKMTLALMAVLSLSLIAVSLVGIFVFPNSIVGGLAHGILALGVAYIGVTRAALEMFDHHCGDRVAA
ncbi:MAG: hypothetical protein GVY12_12420 [Bacteroidetes bacterium]|nr:hypothetical protein [Bacteroidota bacterium]